MVTFLGCHGANTNVIRRLPRPSDEGALASRGGQREGLALTRGALTSPAVRLHPASLQAVRWAEPSPARVTGVFEDTWGTPPPRPTKVSVKKTILSRGVKTWSTVTALW